MRRLLPIAALVPLFASACGPRGSGGRSGPDAPAPVIDSIRPTSGRMGTAYPVLVTLFGHGFAADGNVVTFGEIEITGRPSADDGTTLRFSVPKVHDLGLEAPPRVLQPGAYDVTVTTPAGTSNAVTFTMTRNP